MTTRYLGLRSDKALDHTVHTSYGYSNTKKLKKFDKIETDTNEEHEEHKIKSYIIWKETERKRIDFKLSTAGNFGTLSHSSVTQKRRQRY